MLNHGLSAKLGARLLRDPNVAWCDGHQFPQEQARTECWDFCPTSQTANIEARLTVLNKKSWISLLQPPRNRSNNLVNVEPD